MPTPRAVVGRGLRVGCLTGLACFVGCRDTAAPVRPPIIGDVSMTSGANNVLSAEARFTARDADSARGICDDGNGDRAVTPFVDLTAGAARIVVLGLLASRHYACSIDVRGRVAILSAPVSVTTSELPSPIRSLRLRADHHASPGLTLVAPLLPDVTPESIGYLVAFDSAGDIRWYQALPGVWPIEAKQLPNGHITVYAGRSYGFQQADGQFLELAATGQTIRTYSLGGSSFTDPHELLLTFDDTTLVAEHMLGYDIRPFDLSAFGGAAVTPLAVHFIERRTAGGDVQFHWSAGGLFTPRDWPLVPTPAVDLDHPSSLAIDGEGNYIVSFQAMSEVTRIDSRTGAVLWRLGGRHNEFAFQGDPLGGFSGQHHVQVLPNGHLLLLDDQLHLFAAPARAVEYVLDPVNKVATLVWQYQPASPIISPIMGSVQRLRSGATLIGFGAAGRVVEVGPEGSVTWEARLTSSDGVPVAFYRAIRMVSLYRYASP